MGGRNGDEIWLRTLLTFRRIGPQERNKSRQEISCDLVLDKGGDFPSSEREDLSSGDTRVLLK